MQPFEPAAGLTAPRLRLVDGSVAGPGSGDRGAPPLGSVAVCIPARDEAGTIGAIVTAVAHLAARGVVDDLVVIDDGSRDGTGEGGRVTELVARPLLRRFFPDLGTIAQPLAGECALTRDLAERLRFDDGYGIEIGALIDTYLAHGRRAITEVDIGGERVHRNRPLHELTVHAHDVLAAVLARTAAVPELAESGSRP